MILRRLGNKKKLMPKLLPLFPPHKIFIDVFFGSGSVFFYKPKAQYNIVNDLDSDVFNLFQVVMNQKEELEKAFYLMPIHSDLLEYWKKNKETEPIKKALRFLFLSNFTYMGKPDTMKLGIENPKKQFFKYIDNCFEMLADVQFSNKDFRKFLCSISYRNQLDKDSSFYYLDPPYVSTNDNYSNSFTKQDSIDLFDCVIATGCKFGMSEFDNEFIINQAKERGLFIHYLGERQNLKNRRSEIYICNYKVSQLEMF
jgi:DNA adenine methylase